jgi:hypothetical protein
MILVAACLLSAGFTVPSGWAFREAVQSPSCRSSLESVRSTTCGSLYAILTYPLPVEESQAERAWWGGRVMPCQSPLFWVEQEKP